MSRYLIDTNIIVDFWRGKTFFKNFDFGKDCSINVIILSELYCGAEKSSNPAKSKKLIESFIKDFDIEIVDINKETAKFYGLLRSKLEKKGERLEDFDLIIASSCVQFDMTLITNNIKHFRRIKNLRILKPV